MPSIHFVCRNNRNVKSIADSIYESGDWDVTVEEAAELVGGMIYLHKTKSKPSYFGGRIEDYREVKIGNARTRRIIFKLTFLREGRDAKWAGKDHSRAWTSGILKDPARKKR